MPFRYHIYPTHRTGAVAFAGGVTGVDMIAAMETLYSDSEWRPGFTSIWDLRSITSLSVSPDEVDAIADRAAELCEWAGHGKVAAITRREVDEMIVQLLAYRCRNTARSSVRFFNRLSEALIWVRSTDPVARSMMHIGAA